jgi:hypothetical protein
MQQGQEPFRTLEDLEVYNHGGKADELDAILNASTILTILTILTVLTVLTI